METGNGIVTKLDTVMVTKETENKNRMLVVKEKPFVAREENPLLLGKPLVTKETPCC